MTNTILRPNAVSLYAFLSFIEYYQEPDESSVKKKILDCGAGGPVPPLVLFHNHGFNCTGIDISPRAIGAAKMFCDKHNLPIHFKPADMGAIPFPDESFDYLYEQYSLCHLGKEEAGNAIGEMGRVLKPGGLAYLGFISPDSWPMMGKEQSPGEWALIEGGRKVLHSVYSDEELDLLLSDWRILQKEQHTTWSSGRMRSMGKNEWRHMGESIENNLSQEEWDGLYDQREDLCKYSHMYYIVQKR